MDEEMLENLQNQKSSHDQHKPIFLSGAFWIFRLVSASKFEVCQTSPHITLTPLSDSAAVLTTDIVGHISFPILLSESQKYATLVVEIGSLGWQDLVNLFLT